MPQKYDFTFCRFLQLTRCHFQVQASIRSVEFKKIQTSHKGIFYFFMTSLLEKKGNSGMGLIAILVTVTITAILSLSIASMLKFFSTTVGYQSSRGNLESTLASLDRVFLDSDTCQDAFVTATGTRAKIDGTIPVGGVASSPNGIRYRSGGNLITAGQEIGTFKVTSISLIRQGGPVGIKDKTGTDKWRWDMVLKIVADLKEGVKAVGGRSSITRNYTVAIVTPNALDGANLTAIETCSESTSVLLQQFCLSIAGGAWSAADGLCRIGAEARTTDPASPAIGQIWFRTDL